MLENETREENPCDAAKFAVNDFIVRKWAIGDVKKFVRENRDVISATSVGSGDSACKTFVYIQIVAAIKLIIEA